MHEQAGTLFGPSKFSSKQLVSNHRRRITWYYPASLLSARFQNPQIRFLPVVDHVRGGEIFLMSTPTSSPRRDVETAGDRST